MRGCEQHHRDYTELQEAPVDSLRRVDDKEIVPLAQEMDGTETFAKHLTSVFGELGLMHSLHALQGEQALWKLVLEPVAGCSLDPNFH